VVEAARAGLTEEVVAYRLILTETASAGMALEVEEDQRQTARQRVAQAAQGFSQPAWLVEASILPWRAPAVIVTDQKCCFR
jgi:hypothetical protein